MSSPIGGSGRILVTGGAGFIGSALVRTVVAQGRTVLNLDKLTYSGNLGSLRSIEGAASYHFARSDICDAQAVAAHLRDFRPDTIIHLAAESHVDRSIADSADFVRSNVTGTHRLLEATLAYWRQLPPSDRGRFRFVHVSTDEVFGSLALDAPARFDESSPYRPTSPYAATKAASDHLARSWLATYGLPVIVTNGPNNFGPFQHPEKLIPLAILNALEWSAIPIYGNGENVREWLHVDDHVDALLAIAEQGRAGETYIVGGGAEMSNLQVIGMICDHLDRLLPSPEGRRRRDLGTFVPDRPGHDLRYAVDGSKLERELGRRSSPTFEVRLAETIEWYLDNQWWWQPLRAKAPGEQSAGGRSESASGG